MRHLVAVLRKYSALMIIMEKVASACRVSPFIILKGTLGAPGGKSQA